MSETFAVAWRRFGELPDPPLPWLLGVARNVLRENFRAQARRETFAAEARGWLEGGGDAGAPAGDVADEVADRLAVLRAGPHRLMPIGSSAAAVLLGLGLIARSLPAAIG